MTVNIFQYIKVASKVGQKSGDGAFENDDITSTRQRAGYTALICARDSVAAGVMQCSFLIFHSSSHLGWHIYRPFDGVSHRHLMTTAVSPCNSTPRCYMLDAVIPIQEAAVLHVGQVNFACQNLKWSLPGPPIPSSLKPSCESSSVECLPVFHPRPGASPGPQWPAPSSEGF